MANEVIALGWYVRFVPLSVMDVMWDYYANVIGLPQSLKWRTPNGDAENKDYFWGGEATIIDHNYGGAEAPVGPREADPDTARQMQVFRVSDIDVVVKTLKDRGAKVTPVRPCYQGREAFIVDPMEMLIGIRQRDENATLPQDREALRRRLRGEGFNPGCVPMPEHWQEIGWIRITVADMAGAKNFYRDIIGLPLIAEPDGCVWLDLGDNVILELAPGGVKRAPPERQMASLISIILRVSNMADTMAAYKAANVHFVHDMLTSPKGDWTYISDPEGNVIGVSQRHHPKSYLGRLPAYPEDLEAARRWAETTAARRS